MKKHYIIPLITTLIGILIGYFIFSKSDASPLKHTQHIEEVWTCSMHPQIRKSQAGKCPICAMDLVLLNTANKSEPLSINMSPTALQLANVQTEIVEKSKAEKTITLNGKVKTDERKVFSQTTHVSGRIERLLVNSTGEKVHKGQVLAYVYSPEIINAQKELFEAKKMAETQPLLFSAAKEKLKNFKLTNEQIEGIIHSGKITKLFPIQSDLTGIITKKNVNLGDHIGEGASIYEIADLRSVWILFDVYERDLSWVKIGSKIEYRLHAFPGKIFSGKVSFIDPILNPITRTANARIVVDNTAGSFKPEMFVTGLVKTRLNALKNVILIPKSAIMWTGIKSIIYTKNVVDGNVSFTYKEVVLGTSIGTKYIVKSGLNIGEEIATNGTFSIDAAAQLAGKPSMMNPNRIVKPAKKVDNAAVFENLNTATRQKLNNVIEQYLILKNYLVNDEFEPAIVALKSLEKALKSIPMNGFNGADHHLWMKQNSLIIKNINSFKDAKSIKDTRKYFISLSNSIIQLAVAINSSKSFYVQYCPMANNNKGAKWLSSEKKIRNPYFGDAMLNCGSVKAEFGGAE